MPRGMGRFRRVVAGLLALVLLALPGAPVGHASAAVAIQHQAALHHCGGHEDPSPVQASTSAHHHQDHGQPCDDSGGKPGLACCASAQCPALVGAPPLATAGPLPHSGPTERLAVLASGAHGLDIAPMTPPPRDA